MFNSVEHAAFDLDCDARSDSVSIVRIVFRDHLIVQRGARVDTVPLLEEVRTRLRGAGDIDGDGRLDLLIVETDESSIEPRVLRITETEVMTVPFAMPYELRSPAVLVDLENSDECRERAMPRLERLADGRVAVNIVLNTRLSLRCDDMPRMVFVLRDNRLLPLQAP